ncbi:uncharacterized protein LOC118768575 isoform X3 [Octopus sinensis]|nr:uncharacterized protein LOC118768575 isoform X3 [Octopus sinensis]
MTVVRTNDRNEMSFYRNTQWIKTYAISMGARSKVFKSFMNIGSPSTWNVDKCRGVFCPNFFRHPILDFWKHLPIEEVKLVIYKNQTPVVTMIFDGRNSNLESWFSHANLKSSPWDDLSSANPKFFQMKGVFGVRRFYITNHNGGCSVESGWLALNEAGVYCAYDKMNHFPAIRYSDAKSRTIWNNGYALADSMAIFIRLRQQN